MSQLQPEQWLQLCPMIFQTAQLLTYSLTYSVWGPHQLVIPDNVLAWSSQQMQESLTKVRMSKVICLGDKSHLFANSPVPLALGGGQWNGSSLFYLLVKCRQRHRYLGTVLFTRVQERSVISNTSLPLARPVGWAETFQHETFRLLWCWDASGPHLGTSIWPYPIC